MKYTYILFILAFLQVPSLFAQMDVSITSTHFIYSNYGYTSNGSISITVSGSEYVPYTIEVLQGEIGPCLEAPTISVIDPTITINLSNPDKCVGNYCFLITSHTTDELGETTLCYAEVCTTVNICYERLVEVEDPNAHDYILRYCGEDFPVREKNNVNLHDDPIYLVGYENQYPDDRKIYFDFLVDFPYSTSTDLQELIYTQTDEFSTLIFEQGTSPYDVRSQNEIDADNADFIYKYDSKGNIEWIYHNYNRTTKGFDSTTEISNNNINNHSNSTTLRIDNIYPNPFKNTINVLLDAKVEQTIEVHLLDILGKGIFSTTQSLSLGYNHIDLQISDALPEGIYLLQVRSADGQQILTHKLIH